MNETEKYYNKFNEDKRLKSRHGQVEFHITTKYLLKYLKKMDNPKILDVGAGTGAYSIFLHKKGYDVCAVELVKKNLSVLKQNCDEFLAIQGDATNLKKIGDNSVDVTLLFGPMYHLFSEEDKQKALCEAKRVTKNGGLIFVAYYMNDYAVISHGFVDENINNCLKNNQLTKNFKIKDDIKNLYSFYRIKDINDLNKKANLKRLKIIGVDGATDYIRKTLNKMNDETFKIYLKYVEILCENKNLIGASSHVLDILKNTKST